MWRATCGLTREKSHTLVPSVSLLSLGVISARLTRVVAVRTFHEADLPSSRETSRPMMTREGWCRGEGFERHRSRAWTKSCSHMLVLYAFHFFHVFLDILSLHGLSWTHLWPQQLECPSIRPLPYSIPTHACLLEHESCRSLSFIHVYSRVHRRRATHRRPSSLFSS